MKLGVIGLGRMGRAIAERLEETGAELVVWNRSPSRAEGLAAERADEPRGVIAKRDIVLSVLANAEAIDEVYFGPGGICTGPLDGKLVVEFCTNSPDTSERLAARIAQKGGEFLECPVGGTVAPARAGRLLGMAGGSDAAFARARPVLELLTRRLDHLGPVGTGSAMKLSINLPLMVYWAALGEALGLVLKKGIDPQLALDILADSSGAISAAKTRVPPIGHMLATGQSGDVNFALDGALKDMRLMEALAEEHGQVPAVISAARAKAESAVADRFGTLDASMMGLHGLATPKSEET